jgi:tRNA pseudouridine55 synthase
MGVLVVDKPEGPSSFAVLRRVRALVGRALAGGEVKARKLKCGHGGTLDPAASGVLPICFGEATKLAAFLLEADKTYDLTVRFGVSTDTQDATGAVVDRGSIEGLTEAAIRDLLPGMTGEIEQVPPMYSALKHQGRPLYAYAREGQEIQRAPRRVRIHQLDLVAFLPPDSARLLVRCSKGTYVRVLAADLGRAAGTGAHLTALRRTASGPFQLEQAMTLAQLEDRVDRGEALPFISPATALAHLPGVRAGEAEARALGQGQRVPAAAFGLPAASRGRVRILREDDSLLAVAELTAEGAQPLRVFGRAVPGVQI